VPVGSTLLHQRRMSTSHRWITSLWSRAMQCGEAGRRLRSFRTKIGCWKRCRKVAVYGPLSNISSKGTLNGFATSIALIVIYRVELALQDPSSLLVFSGGQTRTIAQETEGDSYFRISNALNLYDPSNSLIPPEIAGIPGAPLQDGSKSDSTNTTNAKAHADALTQDDSHKSGTSVFFPRATTEQFAMDSYQNLLFSLCRFKEYVCLRLQLACLTFMSSQGDWPIPLTNYGRGLWDEAITIHRRPSSRSQISSELIYLRRHRRRRGDWAIISWREGIWLETVLRRLVWVSWHTALEKTG